MRYLDGTYDMSVAQNEEKQPKTSGKSKKMIALPQNEVYTQNVADFIEVKGGDERVARAETHTIREWRRLRDVTMREAAEWLDVHENTYRRMEQKPSGIKIGQLLTLCTLLGVHINQIDLEMPKPKNIKK